MPNLKLRDLEFRIFHMRMRPPRAFSKQNKYTVVCPTCQPNIANRRAAENPEQHESKFQVSPGLEIQRDSPNTVQRHCFPFLNQVECGWKYDELWQAPLLLIGGSWSYLSLYGILRHWIRTTGSHLAIGVTSGNAPSQYFNESRNKLNA